jgi:hypothetical protein
MAVTTVTEAHEINNLIKGVMSGSIPAARTAAATLAGSAHKKLAAGVRPEDVLASWPTAPTTPLQMLTHALGELLNAADLADQLELEADLAALDNDGMADILDQLNKTRGLLADILKFADPRVTADFSQLAEDVFYGSAYLPIVRAEDALTEAADLLRKGGDQ